MWVQIPHLTEHCLSLSRPQGAPPVGFHRQCSPFFSPALSHPIEKQEGASPALTAHWAGRGPIMAAVSHTKAACVHLCGQNHIANSTWPSVQKPGAAVGELLARRFGASAIAPTGGFPPFETRRGGFRLEGRCIPLAACGCYSSSVSLRPRPFRRVEAARTPAPPRH